MKVPGYPHDYGNVSIWIQLYVYLKIWVYLWWKNSTRCSKNQPGRHFYWFTIRTRMMVAPWLHFSPNPWGSSIPIPPWDFLQLSFVELWKLHEKCHDARCLQLFVGYKVVIWLMIAYSNTRFFFSYRHHGIMGFYHPQGAPSEWPGWFLNTINR